MFFLKRVRDQQLMDLITIDSCFILPCGQNPAEFNQKKVMSFLMKFIMELFSMSLGFAM